MLVIRGTHILMLGCCVNSKRAVLHTRVAAPPFCSEVLVEAVRKRLHRLAVAITWVTDCWRVILRHNSIF